jgi:choline dehydrogenase-like flavoprotein
MWGWSNRRQSSASRRKLTYSHDGCHRWDVHAGKQVYPVLLRGRAFEHLDGAMLGGGAWIAGLVVGKPHLPKVAFACSQHGLQQLSRWPQRLFLT